MSSGATPPGSAGGRAQGFFRDASALATGGGGRPLGDVSVRVGVEEGGRSPVQHETQMSASPSDATNLSACWNQEGSWNPGMIPNGALAWTSETSLKPLETLDSRLLANIRYCASFAALGGPSGPRGCDRSAEFRLGVSDQNSSKPQGPGNRRCSKWKGVIVFLAPLCRIASELDPPGQLPELRGTWTLDGRHRAADGPRRP